jgi:radical SAM enzyme (TIGR01210 family)
MPKKRITIPVFIPHSGCPHYCVFCNQWRVTGVSVNNSSETVNKTITRYLSAIPESVERVELAFFGGSFTAIPFDEQVELLSSVIPYIQEGVIDSLRISTRPDYIDKYRLELLKKFSVKTVELGVQSFSNDVLHASGRGHNSEQVIEAVSLLKEYGFRVGIQLMPGLPLDTYETSIQSALKTVELLPEDVRIYPAVVLKDTMLEKMFFNKQYTPLSIEEAVELCSVMYGLFNENGINIIRMGLHPMELNSCNVVAGPYHEALGFMIKSRYRRRILEEIVRTGIERSEIKNNLSLLIPQKMKEEFIGMKKENISYLKNKFLFAKIDYAFADITTPQILI